MTLRLHPFTGEDTLLPMASEGGGRFSVTVTLPETPCVLWYSFRTGDDETCAWQITVYKKSRRPRLVEGRRRLSDLSGPLCP